ncbi:unnamed protein product [Gongylonema pulchrum]|uniref:Uncharacterized protein n=1 Tax=Gongylonema pulchrum TaxID=637853 RepID=A0A183D8T0_9BILA|nr:unnamed protein product [Gongylonema pulchrum]
MSQCYSVLCFQEFYHYLAERPMLLEERVSPFFQWFRLPRVRAPSLKEEYTVYEEDIPQPVVAGPSAAAARHRRNQDRTYEVTTTTESYHRTISPPQQQHQSGYNGY